MQRIIRHINQYVDLSADSASRLLSATTPCSFRNKEVMVRADVCNRYAYFVVEGMTRSYWMHDGEEITTSFSVPGSVVFSMDELYYDLPSQEYVAAIGSVSAYRILIKDLRDLFAECLDLCNYSRIIHQIEYRRIHQSHKERLTLPAKERYVAFVEQFPEVARNVPLSYMASYLGITLSTLSRLRKAGI